MRLNLFFSIILTFAFISSLSAQEDIQIGSMKYNQLYQSGFFDYSDPSGINIKVQLWGYVKYSGYYVIPARSSVNDLISLAGGPTQDALMEDIRILRTNPDSSNTMYKYNYDDLLWNDKLGQPVKWPRLLAGDMVIVPGEPRYFVRQDVGFFLSIITSLATVISAAAIIISVTK
ncbi:MAG: hypothetical protein A2W11_10965 [Ignavibacteria bacterium RBG_16_35_7]|nr:MAG: hypothetical protein A2W11_10965 [Ignavibacteria bacterium RBG_16_35_7]